MGFISYLLMPVAAKQEDSDYSAIKIHRGLSIYKVRGSQFYYVRSWDSENKRYRVSTTGETTTIEARKAAIQFGLKLLKSQEQVDRQYTFRHFGLKALQKGERLVADGERNRGTVKANEWALQNADWGLLKRFGDKDVRKIRTNDFNEYMEHLSKRHPDLAQSSKNSIMSAFRNVLKMARDAGVVDEVIDTPRAKQRDNPRPFFRFHPVCSQEDDAYQKLLTAARAMATEGVLVRGIPVTDELRDLILFLAHSFVRPLSSELYALKHADVTVSTNPRGLVLVVRNGKTGYRSVNTMPTAVSVYDRIRRRFPDAKGDDYLFLPQYRNRTTAAQIVQRQFAELLKRSGLERDIFTGKKHELYSLRHTAICMRLVNSHGQVNIYTLAKNAGTSVDQIERFYAKHLPMTPNMWDNLTSFGDA